MDKRYQIGIPAIDSQHEEISELVDLLQAWIAEGREPQLVHPTVKRLYHLVHDHFDYEEALMKMVNYPQLEPHRKVHEELLGLIADYCDEQATAADQGQLARTFSDKVLGHVLEHDALMAASLKDYLRTFRSLLAPDLASTQKA